MKFAIMSDLIVPSILLILTICVFEEKINLSLLLSHIGIITCFLEESLVVILIFGLGLPESLIAL